MRIAGMMRLAEIDQQKVGKLFLDNLDQNDKQKNPLLTPVLY
jgi:hypothetical protein